MAVTIAGRQFWLWRAVDDEGEVLDLLVPRRRDKAAAVKLMRSCSRNGASPPTLLVTDKLLLQRGKVRKMGCLLVINRACTRTIGLRIRTSRHGGASARCSVSNRRDQLSASCPFMPPSKTLSTSGAISHPAARSASGERKPSGRGERLLLPETELQLQEFLPAKNKFP